MSRSSLPASASSTRLTRPGSRSAKCFASSIVDSIAPGDALLSMRFRISGTDSSRIVALTSSRGASARDHLVEIEQRLAEHRQLGRRLEAVRRGGPVHLEQQAADLQVRERRALDTVVTRSATSRRKPASSNPSRRSPSSMSTSAASSGSPFGGADQQFEQPLLNPGRQLADHPEIDQRHPAVVGQEHVAGMRVGVKEPVDDDLMQIGAHQLAAQLLAVDVDARQRAERGDLRAEDVVHRQHARRRVVVHRLRHDDRRELGEMLAERPEIARFVAVVELGERRLAELRHHLREVDARLHAAVLVEERGELVERFQILGNALLDVRALHLDRDQAPVAQRRAMNLAERRGGDRLRLEHPEALGQPDAELRLDDALDLGERERLDVVLQPRQRLDVGGRQQIGACRQQLSELDEGRTERLESRARAVRRRRAADRRALRGV